MCWKPGFMYIVFKIMKVLLIAFVELAASLADISLMTIWTREPIYEVCSKRIRTDHSA